MFGRRKKHGGSKNSPKNNMKHFSVEELSVTPKMVEEAILQAKLPEVIKEALINELPNFVEFVDETTNKIFNPSAIWFESIQFADYVAQLATHLGEEHGGECREEIAGKLIIMSENFKELAEHAMKILDNSEKSMKHGA
jgi:hypothetical protein